MRSLPTILATAALLYLPVTTNAAEIAIDQVLNYERQFIESRRSLQGHATVSVQRDSPSGELGTTTYVAYFADERLRTRRLGDVQREYVLTPDVMISDSGNDQKVFVREDELPTPRQAGTKVSDPRLLGVVAAPFETISYQTYESYLRNDRRDLRAVTETRDGQQIIRVTYSTRAGDALYEYWMVPEKDFQIIYVSVRSPTLYTSVRSSLERFGDVWFPKAVYYRREHNGVLAAETRTTVDDVQFADALPADTFTLAGLGLRPGRVVNRSREDLVWTGRELVPIPSSPSVQPRASAGRVSIIVLALAVVIAGLVGGWMAWRRF